MIMFSLLEDIYSEILEAENRISEAARVTPFEYSPVISAECGCEAWLKLENYQRTGSFKLRGAANRIFSLSEDERSKRLVTSSTGNHGSAFAWAAGELGLDAAVYVPENIERGKLETLRLYDIDIEFFGTDCVESEARARKDAEEKGYLYIPPYNDPKIIAGQGTVALEMTGQSGGVKFDSFIAPVGGGGLISGICAYLRPAGETAEIIGCQPANSPVMAESVKAGEIVEMESRPTISDGTSGGIEAGSVTFDICREYVDDFILVTEDEIIDAIRLMLSRHFMLIEGSGALAVAALLKEKKRFKGKKVALVITGSKLGAERLAEISKAWRGKDS